VRPLMLVLFQDHYKEERNEELKGATTTKTRKKKKKKKKRELPIAPQLPLEKHKFYEDFQFF
jgi:hypothetical protein